MQCNCLTEAENKLKEKLTVELGVAVEVRSTNETFVLAKNSFEARHFTNFKITANAKGYTRGKDMPLISNYCPICGKAAKANTEGAQA